MAAAMVKTTLKGNEHTQGRDCTSKQVVFTQSQTRLFVVCPQAVEPHKTI